VLPFVVTDLSRLVILILFPRSQPGYRSG